MIIYDHICIRQILWVISPHDIPIEYHTSLDIPLNPLIQSASHVFAGDPKTTLPSAQPVSSFASLEKNLCPRQPVALCFDTANVPYTGNQTQLEIPCAMFDDTGKPQLLRLKTDI